MPPRAQSGDPSARPAAPPWGHTAGRLLAAAGLALAAASLAGRAGTLWWVLELASHWRVQYLLAFLVVAAGCLALRSWRWAALFGLLAVLELASILPLYLPPEGPAGAGRTWRLVSINTRAGGDNGPRVAAAIRDLDPDLVLLMEINPDLLEEVERLRADYPHRLQRPERLPRGYRDAFGLVLLSKAPLGEGEFLDPGRTGVPAVSAVVDLDGRGLRLVGAHLYPPESGPWAALRNVQLENLAERFGRLEGPGLLCGDLNVSPWSPWFGRALRRGRLRDSSLGFGVQPTWPARFPPLWIPIDHCLVTSGVRVVDRFTGPDVGSDHLPLVVDFRLAE